MRLNWIIAYLINIYEIYSFDVDETFAYLLMLRTIALLIIYLTSNQIKLLVEYDTFRRINESWD